MRTVILLLEVSNEDLLSFLSANLRFVKSISLRFFCICCFSFTNLKKSVDFLFISTQTHFLKQYPEILILPDSFFSVSTSIKKFGSYILFSCLVKHYECSPIIWIVIPFTYLLNGIIERIPLR